MGKRITIKEIAEKAGVSSGTVDRVLHNRGNVSRRSRIAIEKVLAMTGYAGEDFYSISTKACSLAVLTPTSTYGDYWSAVYQGIDNALQQFRYAGISVEYFSYNQFDVYSCLSAEKLLLKRKPQGVIIGPTFLEEARRFCATLEQSGIPYVFVDSYFDGTHPLATFSTDQISGGKVMGHLLAAGTRSGGRLAVFESRRSGARLSSNSLVRRDGFVEYLRSIGREADLIETCYTSTEPSENEGTLRTILGRHPDLAGIAVLNSRGSSLAEILENLGRTDIRLVSFDLTARNIEYLRRGSLHALLCQHPMRQGFEATSVLVNYLMKDIRPESVYHYLPIDIVLKENLDLYKE